MGNMTGHSPLAPFAGGCGGACCNTKVQLRARKKTAKQKEKREWRAEQEKNR